MCVLHYWLLYYYHYYCASLSVRVVLPSVALDDLHNVGPDILFVVFGEAITMILG
jgi:hypothetical protein